MPTYGYEGGLGLGCRLYVIKRINTNCGRNCRLLEKNYLKNKILNFKF